MHQRALIVACTVLALSCATRAEQPVWPQSWMSDAEIKSAFAGQTIDGHYANGDGFTESYLAGGRIDYKEKVRKLSGRWSVESGTFCTIYDTSPTGGCFRVRQMSANCFEFYFVARDESEAIVRPGQPSWTARGWRKDKQSTCEEGANV